MRDTFEHLNRYILGGLAVMLIGRIAPSLDKPLLWVTVSKTSQIEVTISLIGYLLMIFGGVRMVEDKGYCKWLGLLGVFPLVGCFILWVLPKKTMPEQKSGVHPDRPPLT